MAPPRTGRRSLQTPLLLLHQPFPPLQRLLRLLPLRSSHAAAELVHLGDPATVGVRRPQRRLRRRVGSGGGCLRRGRQGSPLAQHAQRCGDGCLPLRPGDDRRGARACGDPLGEGCSEKPRARAEAGGRAGGG